MIQPFASAAIKYHGLGLYPFPCGGDDGKTPSVKNWKRKRSLATVERMAERFPTANVGIPTGTTTGLTVIDVDDDALAGDIIERCGDTPVKASTPRGGRHLFYRFNGEKTFTGLDGDDVDVRAAGGLVIVPPSFRADVGDYRLLEGDFRHLDRLPTVKPGSLPLAGTRTPKKSPVAVSTANADDWLAPVCEGRRNTVMFDHLRAIGNTVGSRDALAYHAWEINRDFFPPLPDAEVMRVMASVWRMVEEGHCIPPGGGPCAFLPGWVLEALHDKPDAIAVLAHLLRFHGARRDPFAIAPHASVKTFGMPHGRIRAARAVLIERGFLEPVHAGGKGIGDYSTFRLCRISTSPERAERGVSSIVSRSGD